MGADPFDDQLNAAAAEASGMNLALAQASSARRLDPRSDDLWLRRAARAATLAVAEGRGCEHFREGGPRPIVVAAWDAAWPLCVRCVGRMQAPEGEETCDRCGKIVAHTHWCQRRYGPVLVVSGICCACLEELGGECQEQTGSAGRGPT